MPNGYEGSLVAWSMLLAAGPRAAVLGRYVMHDVGLLQAQSFPRSPTLLYGAFLAQDCGSKTWRAMIRRNLGSRIEALQDDLHELN